MTSSNNSGRDSDFKLGLEQCVIERPSILDRSRFGLLMNRASVNRDLRLASDILDEAYPNQLKALFSPQHGFWGDVQANMIETADGWHSRLGIPVYSLYGETRTPTAEMLSNLDCLVIDLQDVGTRVYTFVWTMLECLKACAQADVSILVLDRPNPIGGCVIEGPLLDAEFHSFVGGACIPMRHGLTIGEMAQFLNTDQQINADLEVAQMTNWRPKQSGSVISRTWIPPSPNLPTLASAQVYPGQVLLEGTNLSEGRGTTTPFEVMGAPFIDAEILSDELNESGIDGARFLPLTFRPTFDKWHGQLCNGVSLHVTDPIAYRPYRTTVMLLAAVQRNWPNDFRWLDPPYEYEKEKPPIDIISGSDSLRTCNNMNDPSSLDALTVCPLESWRERTNTAWLYEETSCRFEN